jgi:asparagine synthase (glutamine-hydrolysing)
VTAFFLLSEQVAREVKVVQCGQGADEIFAGYDYHHKVANVARDRAAAAFQDAFADRSSRGLATMVEPELLLETDVGSALLQEQLSRPGADTALDAVLRLDTHLLMIDDPVKRVDNMSMTFGLEARVPFLDHDVVELAASCPPELKAPGDGKLLLKELGRELLPGEIIDRPKGYFPLPALTELQGPVLTLIRDTLNSREARSRGLFRRDYLDNLLDEPNGRRLPTGGNELWQVAVLELWLQDHQVG